MTKELANDLRKAALEIAAAGHAGWGNACSDGADAIDAMQARVAELDEAVSKSISGMQTLASWVDRTTTERDALSDELAAIREQIILDRTLAPIPPVREPLSDNTILGIYNKVGQEDGAPYRFAGAIEAAIKEKSC